MRAIFGPHIRGACQYFIKLLPANLDVACALAGAPVAQPQDIFIALRLFRNTQPHGRVVRRLAMPHCIVPGGRADRTLKSVEQAAGDLEDVHHCSTLIHGRRGDEHVNKNEADPLNTNDDGSISSPAGQWSEAH